MKYSYREGVRKQKSRRWVLLPVVGFIGGLYLLLNVFSSEVLYVTQPADTTAKKLISQQPNLDENRVYIPKINVDVAIVPIEGGEKFALEKGAIHRSPSSGNPKDGGNYVLVANRFSLGLTPQQTRAKSPFYHIGKLNKDDDAYVDYKGVRYAYKVEAVAQSYSEEMSARTDSNKLTFFAAGSGSDTKVVTATQVGKIIWTSGQPRLKSLDN